MLHHKLYNPQRMTLNKMKAFLLEQYAWNFFIHFGEEKGDTEIEQFKNKSHQFFEAIHDLN